MNLYRRLTSPTMTTVLLAVVFAALFLTTVAPNGVPIELMPPLLCLLAAHLALAMVGGLPRRWSAAGLWLVHTTLVLFCLSTAGLSTGSQDLTVGLTPGASTQEAFVRQKDPGAPVRLPFRLELVSFAVETYPGSREPSDYVSRVRVSQGSEVRQLVVRMNAPARAFGYAIYPSSVEEFEGTVSPVFKLSRSDWRWVPYALSVLLVVGLGLHAAFGTRNHAK